MIQIEPEQFLDPRWRLSNLYTITDKTGTRVPFRPTSAQMALLDDLHSANIISMPIVAGSVLNKCYQNSARYRSALAQVSSASGPISCACPAICGVDWHRWWIAALHARKSAARG
jgi:hypothetical protein